MMHRLSAPLVESAVAVALLLLLLATGCSIAADKATPLESSSSSGDGDANDADRHFMEKVQLHNDQAVEMSKMVLSKKTGVAPEVREVAQEIAEASEHELTTISAWVAAWGSPAPEGHDDEQDPNHHGGSGGLMSEEQMMLLDQLDGSGAQRLYLDGMLQHHQGGVAIAEAQVRDGSQPDALALARQMIARQQSEIARLQELRAG